MLQARKRITKKELQKDAFLKGIYSAKTFYGQNQSTILKVAVGVVVVVFFIYFLNQNQMSKMIDADRAFSIAMFNMGKNDQENALLQLELLVADYSGTESAQKALFILGKHYYQLQDYLTATTYIHDFLDDPVNDYYTSAFLIQAEIERFNKNSLSAIATYEKAIAKGRTDEEKDRIRLELADYYFALGRYDDAELLVTAIANKYENRTPYKQRAEEMIGRLYAVGKETQ